MSEFYKIYEKSFSDKEMRSLIVLFSKNQSKELKLDKSFKQIKDVSKYKKESVTY